MGFALRLGLAGILIHSESCLGDMRIMVLSLRCCVIVRSRWGFEKLVYRKVLEKGKRYDRKYVVQARHAEAAGIHMSMNMKKGINLYPKGDRIRYYHYHGTINKRDEVCSFYVDSGNKTAVQQHDNSTHTLDETMAKLVKDVKLFELQTVGTQPFIV